MATPGKEANQRPLKGHGALSNPAGRFERRQTEPVDDGWYREEVPDSLPASIEPDHARSVISINDSPDIPFEQSINPYRGCSHACTYCMRGDTLILMGDGSTRPLAQVGAGSEIYGTVRQGSYRRYVRTRVLDHWSVIKPAYRILLEDGTELVAGKDHRFLTGRGWKFVTGTKGASPLERPYLTVNSRLMGTGRFAAETHKDSDYKRGYLCGVIRGDAHPATHPCRRSNGAWNTLYQFRLALCDDEALTRAHGYLLDFQVPARQFPRRAVAGGHGAMYGIRTGSRLSYEHIWRLIAWPPAATPSWRAGFLAGIFDSGGSCSKNVLRICNTDWQIIHCIGRCLGESGLRFAIDKPRPGCDKPVQVLRLLGGLRENLRFFHTVDPAIRRRLDIEGQAVKSDAPLRVVSIEPAGTTRLYDMTTGTEDFVANGVISHNCYARPSHSHVGLSPGLDFETRLFYKQDAGRLLERELSRPGYVCKPINLGSNTDPYQPIERRMRVTREIIEVLARCRHPLTIITKGALVVRDLDLLTQLARDNLVTVGISITTLDSDLKRRMEPQAASPRARLEAVRVLSEAGVPTGVLVAPVIPALTDHEMESILEASAAAGGRWATYLLLRLPYEVSDLFQEWLAAHYPDRAGHVMSLVRQMRDGRDNDPRFGTRRRGTGPLSELLRNRFHVACRRLGLATRRGAPLDVSLFRPPGRQTPQLSLDL